MSPSSSAEELTQINEPQLPLSDGVVAGGDGGGPDHPDGVAASAHHHIHKPEPTKSTSSLPHPPPQPPPPGVAPPPAAVGVASGGGYPPPHPPPGSYAAAAVTGKQATPPAPPPGYHSMSLSQPQTAPPPSNPPLGMPSGPMSLSQGAPTYYHGRENPPVGGPHYASGAGYPGRQKAYENVPMVYDNLHHAPMTHPLASQGPKYGGGAQAPPPGGYSRPSHDAHMMKSHGGPHEYSVGGRYGAGSRWKPINPASISVAHDAAASGDIATLVSLIHSKEGRGDLIRGAWHFKKGCGALNQMIIMGHPHFY